MARSVSCRGSDFEKVTATSLIQNPFRDKVLYRKCLRLDVHSRMLLHVVMSSWHFRIP